MVWSIVGQSICCYVSTVSTIGSNWDTLNHIQKIFRTIRMAYSSLLNVERDASLLNDTPKNETIQFFVYKFDMCLYEKIMMNQARNYLLNWPFPGDSIFQFILLMTHFL